MARRRRRRRDDLGFRHIDALRSISRDSQWRGRMLDMAYMIATGHIEFEHGHLFLTDKGRAALQAIDDAVAEWRKRVQEEQAQAEARRPGDARLREAGAPPAEEDAGHGRHEGSNGPSAR